MIGTVKILQNFREMDDYNEAIEEYGKEEAFNLGKFTTPPIEMFSKVEFIFDINDVGVAWIFVDNKEKLINMQMKNNNAWAVCWDEKLWEELKLHFKQREENEKNQIRKSRV